MISSSPTTDLLPGFYILVASTKTISSVDWLFFQDCTHQLLHLSQKFSLILLCSVGSEACPAELKDGRFSLSQPKTSKIWGGNIPLSRPTTHFVPTCSTPRMPFTEELTCNYDLKHDSCALQKRHIKKRTCPIPLQAPPPDFSHRQDPLLSPKTAAVMKKSKSPDRFWTVYPNESFTLVPGRTQKYRVEHRPQPTNKNTAAPE
jgi:hypothetical protein